MQHSWSRTTKQIVLFFLVAGLLGLIVFARELVNSLIIAILFAYLLKPAVDIVGRWPRVQRQTAVMLVYIFFLALVVTLPLLISPIVIGQTRLMADDLRLITRDVVEMASEPVILGDITVFPEGWIVSVLQPIGRALAARTGGAVDLIAQIGTHVLWILVILVSIFYLLRDGPRLRDWLISLLPPSLHSDLHLMVREIDKSWDTFLRGQLALGVIVGILTFLVASAVGLPGALVLAIIAGFLDLIPSLGPAVAGTIATVMAYVMGSTYLPLSNFAFALLVLGLFLAIQQIENIWLRPQIMGNSLRLHPGLVFIGVFGALAISGVIGAIIIVPLMSAAAVIGRYVHPRLVARGQAADAEHAD